MKSIIPEESNLEGGAGGSNLEGGRGGGKGTKTLDSNLVSTDYQKHVMN